MGLNTEGARLIECDIIPQEKWGKPRRANHFNLDLPNPLETSMQEKACGVSRSRDDLIPRAWTGNFPAWLPWGWPARAIRDGKPTKPGDCLGTGTQEGMGRGQRLAEGQSSLVPPGPKLPGHLNFHSQSW